MKIIRMYNFVAGLDGGTQLCMARLADGTSVSLGCEGNMDLRENERRIIWGKSRLQRGSREERNVIDAIKTCLIGGANPTMTEEEMRLGKRLLRMIEEERG